MGDIREAELSDLPELMRMGRLFAKSIGIPMHDESTLDTVEGLIDSDDAVLLIGDGVMAGALAYPLYLNKHITVAQELFWWVDEDKRGNGSGREVLAGLEKWAQGIGAHYLSMMTMQGTSPSFVERVYLDNGYKPFENTYIKVF